MLSFKKIVPGEKKLSLPMLDTPVTVRIKFCKVGNLQFISHLDLQRTFHRVLVRANIPMWYTKGFNPHAKLVFGVPLSVGTESMCEMADLKIERKIDLEDIKNQLNEQLTDEMYILEAYYPTTKFADIAYADYTVTLKSEKINSEIVPLAQKLFSAPVMMLKRSKSGEKEVDITSFIKNIDFMAEDGQLTVNTVLSAGSTENLNPEYVVTAIKTLCDMSDLTYTIMRNKVYDKYLIEFK
jgi:radical SAM-linked protein